MVTLAGCVDSDIASIAPRTGAISVWLNEAEVSVLPSVQNADAFGVGVAKDDERFRLLVDAQGGILDRHRFHGILLPPPDAGPRLRPLVPAAIGRRSLPSWARFARPFTLQGLRLLPFFSRRLTNGSPPRVAFTHAAHR